MIPKIEGCIEVVEAGVEAVVIIDGRVPHCVLLELFTEHGVGTLVTPQGEEGRMRAPAPCATPTVSLPRQRGERVGVRGSNSCRSKRLPLPYPPPRKSGEREPRRARRGFERTQVWIFDLDNTLYPADCNLFAQVDQKHGRVHRPLSSACPSSTRGTCRRPTTASSAPPCPA